MNSNTVNPMDLGSPGEVVRFLQEAAAFELDDAQRENAEIVVKHLGDQATVSSFVEAATQTPGLETFGMKVGSFCLPGSGYSKLYEREYGPLIV